mmetsp:Transcript_10609/g.32454  ORF Transcript_10609/g.32454 Transcript_10609/m.32454 type:complete len:709 (-) Transcript_10609:91-2217(-)|eukprot:CAMPEP_0198733772 /NCGR_PEP_ID=MMETSP1475-20131203/48133_1 /TAXON_ID= ORGANISM="Unidentified sp., Strain CCMP1999" /NCGR_SAMPLE_ID=MMETSP1475 /ASSEMBLY_ACC=CAM_ASM_001111 /LENGTH=708 /DNA_ID=CAMNT_0044497121 /DNA_START=307 /DNA_END=2433 /DNA_ORIENTATION=+
MGYAFVKTCSQVKVGRPSEHSCSVRSLRSRRCSVAQGRRVLIVKASSAGFNPDDKRVSIRGTSATEVFKFLAKISRQENRIMTRLVIAMLLMLSSKVLNLAVPYFFKAAVDAVTTGAVPPQLLKVLPNIGNTGGGKVAVGARVCSILVLLHGFLKLMSTVTHELRNVVFSRAQYAIGRKVTRQAFEHIHSLDADFHSASRTGALVRIVDRGTRSVNGIFRVVLFSFLPSLLEATMVGTVLATQFAPSYAVITLVCFVAFVGATLLLNNRMIRTRKRLNLTENEASAKLSDSLTNFQMVKIFNNEKFESNRYDESLENLETNNVINDKEYSLLNIVQGTIFGIGSTGVLLLSALDIMRGVRTVGDLVMASTLLQQMWVPLNFIGWQYRELKQTLVDMENLLELLARQPKLVDAPDAKPLVVSRGEVRFEDIRFNYSDGEDILKGVSFTVPAGKTAAVVGPSGSGKSTLLGLLYRLRDPSSGKVLIDGQDISKVTTKSLRDALGMIPQDTVLFNDTIEYNIAYAKPGASLEEVKKAARLARIDETISRMPRGYGTKVGERGMRLSGGEKQRVAIARCMLKKPKILLQDEATSALDTQTELEISESLMEIGRQRTCIVVAHRLSTVVSADEIIVLKKGVVVERGRHSQLIRKRGVYAEMWERQQIEESRSVESNGNGFTDEGDMHSNGTGEKHTPSTDVTTVSNEAQTRDN